MFQGCFLNLFFMSIGRHSIFGVQTFCEKNSSPDTTFKHRYNLKNEKEKKSIS